jgi:hypothetical protein
MTRAAPARSSQKLCGAYFRDGIAPDMLRVSRGEAKTADWAFRGRGFDDFFFFGVSI